jgi:hypothetical protein
MSDQREEKAAANPVADVMTHANMIASAIRSRNCWVTPFG